MAWFILARLLSPKDFGVVAIGMLVVGLFEIFSRTGLRQALIQAPVVTLVAKSSDIGAYFTGSALGRRTTAETPVGETWTPPRPDSTARSLLDATCWVCTIVHV